MKQKTAMAELIEAIQESFKELDLTRFNKVADKLFEKEKQQIIDAHDDGYNHGLLETGIHAEEYYTKTFNPTQKQN